MTKQEAIEAMKQAAILTHVCFSDGDYIFQIESTIYMEDEESIDEEGIEAEKFWNDRSSIQWETGWEIYKN